MNLNELWSSFVEERSISLCPTSLSSDYAQITKWFERCPIQDTTEGRKIMTWVLSQSPSLYSRRVAMYLKSLYRWAVQEDVELISKNPLLSFRMPKAPQIDDEIIVIPRKEIAIVLSELSRKKHHRKINWSYYTNFMLQTAMRTGEVRAMKWNDIKNNKVLVHSNYTLTHGLKNSTKTNKKRWVPLNEKCLKILNVLPSDDEYVFPWDRQAFQSFFRSKMKPLYDEGKISHLYRPYDCRHTAISRWIEAGIPVPQVSQWAGNTSEIIFKHYCNVTQEYQIPII